MERDQDKVATLQGDATSDQTEPGWLEELYLATNPDVADAVARGEFANGWQHWLLYGRDERRDEHPTVIEDRLYGPSRVTPPDRLDLSGFDAEGYLFLNPDVKAAVSGSLVEGRRHWVEHGRFERRFGPGVGYYAQRRTDLAALMAKPPGLDIYGPFAAVSGLGTAAREFVRAVKAAGIPFKLHCFDVSKGPCRITQAQRRALPEHRVNLILANADQLQQCTAQYEEYQFDNAYNVAMWAWELPALRQDWQSAFALLDEVWTNSTFEVTSILATSPVPVVKVPIPLSVTKNDSAASRALLGLPPTAFLFMLAFDVGSSVLRKNPLAALHAFQSEFGSRDDVQLVIKYHSDSSDGVFSKLVTDAVAGAANIRVLHQRMSATEMAALQNASDCLLAPHRSEGYGLNIAEFMALGKPVIATGYSGNTDFFDESCGFPITYRLTETEQWSGPYPPGYIWAEPDLESLREAMRRVVEDPAEAASRGAVAERRMSERFGHEVIGRQIARRLNGLGLMAPAPYFTRLLGQSKQVRSHTVISHLHHGAREAIADLAAKPLISVIVPVYNVEPALLLECIESVRAQVYPFWELCLADDCSTQASTVDVLVALRGKDSRIKIRRLAENVGIAKASNAAVEIACGEFVLMLDNDDTLTPNALLDIVRALNATPEIDCLYGDEDKIDEEGRPIDHFYKPDWSPEHLESVMYTLHPLVLRKKLFLELGGFRDEYSGAQDYDLMLRASRASPHIHHVAKVLYHWRAIAGSSASVVDAKPYALNAGLRALTEHVQLKYGDAARVEPGLLPGTFRVRRPVPAGTRVTLIIPTGAVVANIAGRGTICMVENFISSIIAKTDYPDYEMLVVDNSRLSAEQVASLESKGVRIENYVSSEPTFNYAAKANFAVRAAKTEIVVLLNDDMEVIRPDWLTALVELALDPGIGAVGARLLHADGSVQHVGCVIGVNGGSAHMYHSAPRDFVGYNGFTHLIRNYAAVTAACVAFRRQVFEEVGGFDETFRIDYNDTDFCLSIIKAGYRIAYTPYAELYHFESQSAKRTDANPRERDRFLDRWPTFFESDPYYNINLARDRLDFAEREPA